MMISVGFDQKVTTDVVNTVNGIFRVTQIRDDIRGLSD